MNARDPTLGLERQPETVFLIAPNAGVWTVTKDGAFYGDYLKQEHAEASAQCAVADLLEKGGAAKAHLRLKRATGQTIGQGATPLEAVACARPSRYPVREA